MYIIEYLSRGKENMKMKLSLALFLVMLVAGSSTLLGQAVLQTGSWRDFGGDSCTINGVLITAGTVIDAYNIRTGAHCGHQDSLGAPGEYKFMPVYGKDPWDPNNPITKNYCRSGDSIAFTINGIQAYRLGPDDYYWDYPAQPSFMRLATSDITEFSIALGAETEGHDSAGQTVSYPVTIKNNGNGVDLIKLTMSSWRGWSFTGWDSAGSYFTSGQSKDFTITVTIPAGEPDTHKDTLTVIATSRFHPSTSDTKRIITTVDHTTAVDGGGFTIPGAFSLDQNFPNPFNPETVISFNLERSANVTLSIYDILGRNVRTLQQGVLPQGQHQFRWNGADDGNTPVASGIYFYRLTADQVSLTRKMALLK